MSCQQPGQEVAQNLYCADDDDLPHEMDWRKYNYVTPVKQQGECGSCWAHSATASVEGQHAKATGQLVSLSEQNLVDCSRKYATKGCGGGTMSQAFSYIRDNGGINTEASYPYVGTEGPCRFNSSNIGAKVKGFVNVGPSEAHLKAAVAKVGPISAGIHASRDDFHTYRGGVYNPEKCVGPLDHAVTVAGYGKDADSGLDYWLVKNSYGTDWGEGGYMKLARNQDNKCSIASYASYPVIDFNTK